LRDNAGSDGFDLAVLGTRGRTALVELIVGSVARGAPESCGAFQILPARIIEDVDVLATGIDARSGLQMLLEICLRMNKRCDVARVQTV
jgi:hypothetical protein